ncbi:MAG: hypothetical protein MJ145_00165 [Clostridia bacterium]|nr:hypothetical protein [Clostridia bacterium]
MDSKKALSAVKPKEKDAFTDNLKVNSARTYHSDSERNLKALYDSGILTWYEYEDMKARYAKKYAESDARRNKGLDD